MAMLYSYQTMRDLQGWPDKSDLGTSALERQKKASVGRTENPLVFPIQLDSASFQRFGEITNQVASQFGGVFIKQPAVEVVKPGGPSERQYVTITIAQSGIDHRVRQSFRKHLRSLYQTQTLQEGILHHAPLLLRPFHRNEASYVMSTNVENVKKMDQDYIEGLFIKPDPGKTWGAVELRYGKSNSGPSEVELAYETVMTSLILAGKVDLSTDEKVAETASLRRTLFMDIYQEMLKDLLPQVTRSQIFGMDNQISEIDTNLYQPLITGRGRPMNTLMVGAPGAGKSFAGDYFTTNRKVLTVPFPVKQLDSFETDFLPRLSRMKNAFGLPIVLYIGDIEDLFRGAINHDSRARALNILERMQDTYGIYLLATLNHSDIEAAFWRRFNIVYFPLPTSSQRKQLCAQIIPQGPLTDIQYQVMVAKLADQMEGFNYHGITNIPDFFHNRDGADLTVEAYQQILEEALQKVSMQTNLKELSFLDEAAREMTHRPRRRPAGLIRPKED